MSYVLGWHAWYEEGAEYSSLDIPFTKLPQTGFQIVMLYFKDGTRRTIHGNDRYFFFDNGSEDGVFAQTDDSAAEIAIRYPGAYIIEGTLLPDAVFAAISKLASRRKEP